MEGSPHILVVEDDDDTRFVYGVLLRMEGYLVTHVGTLADGLARALSTNYDLIIIDVRLPDGDGIDLCKKVRAFNKVTPIMFSSAAARAQDIERGMKAGAQAYLVKPSDADTLLERVKYLLGARAMTFEKPSMPSLTEMVSEATVAVALIDFNGNYRAVSESYAKTGGVDPKDLIGKPVAPILAEVSADLADMVAKAGETGSPRFVSRYPQILANAPDGTVTYWDAAAWPVQDNDSQPAMLLVIRKKEQSGDITPH